jgi:hypothetical protein
VTTPEPDRRAAVSALALYGALAVSLVTVPRLVPPVPGVVSAAAVAGYNTNAAFWTVLIWALLVVVIFTLLPDRPADPAPTSSGVSRPAGRQWRPDWRELLAVFAVFSLACFPWFLARYGPYIEDTGFLAILNRMSGEQLPYRDFNFLYGPLMIYPASAWMQAFGFSMASYYAYLALLEGLQFTLLAGVLQFLVPQRRERWIVFLILLPFLFNTLLGLNYNGMRWLVPTLVMLAAAYRPHHRRTHFLCAGGLGLHLAYSHEFALAGLAAVLGMYGVQYLWDRNTATVRAAATITVGSIAVWLVTTAAILRGTMADYITNARDIVGMMSSGHGGFAFYWTANSLALFGLLTIACMRVGRGWQPRPSAALESGDRFLIASVCFALVTLKSGLTRSDLWHLNPDFLPLILSALLRLPANAMTASRPQRKLAVGLAGVAAVTFLVGVAPSGSLYVVSYLRGLTDTLTGVPRGAREAPTRAYSIEFERTAPNADLVALGRYLAEGERAGKPVLFYGRAWDIPPRVGVYPEDYKLDDLLYTELREPEAVYLKKRRDALVVMRVDDYRRLYRLIDPNTPRARQPLTPVKQLGRWLSTVHYDGSENEARVQDETRERLTGSYVRAAYEFAADFGAFVVLAPR